MPKVSSQVDTQTKYRFCLAILLLLPTIVLIGLILFLGPDTPGTTRLDVVNSLLAVFGVWIGAVIAFYFGTENMELAQRGIRNTIETLGPERLKKVTAEEIMLTPVYTITKGQFIYEAIDFLDKKAVDSLVVVDSKERPVGILYRHEIMEYIAKDQATYDEIVKNHKISDVMKMLGWEEKVRDNFLFVHPNNVLASIKTNLENRKLDYAVVVGVNDQAIGFISRLEILKQAIA